MEISGNQIEEHKRDFGIPNEIFYKTDRQEHRKDVYCIKYLMKGNAEWNFKAIANLYDYDISVTNKSLYQNTTPTELTNNILVITFGVQQPTTIPARMLKVMKIFDIIRQAQVQIEYQFANSTGTITIDSTDYLPIEVPHEIGDLVETVDPVDYVPAPRIKLGFKEKEA